MPVFIMAAGGEVRHGLAGDADIGVQAGWAYLETNLWKGMLTTEDADGEEDHHGAPDRSDFLEGSHLTFGLDAKKALVRTRRFALSAQGGATVLVPQAHGHSGGMGASLLAGVLLGTRHVSTGVRIHAGMQAIPYVQVETPLMARVQVFRSPLWLELGLVPSYFYAEGTDNLLWPWQHLGVQWHFGK